jgi:ATP-dependent Lon protease
MEIIRISGYTEDEKVEIARRHLLPKQIEAHGLKAEEWSISDGALRDVIRYYTREAGVRNLEREIANLTRKAIKEIMMGDRKEVHLNSRNLAKYAGVKRFRYGEVEAEDLIGVATGLAWTEVGGELLSIEAVIVPGKGRVTYTGKLGDVMQESIQAAKSFVQSRAIRFGIAPDIFNKRDIHVHVPEGATPKDGPSAGVAMVVSIVSVLTGIPVRKDVAMTGELTLRGRVLPIGGLKEKLLAAHRGGIKVVLIPKENERELSEIADNIKKDLTIIPAAVVDEVLSNALAGELTPIEWDAEAEMRHAPAAAAAADDDDLGEFRTH